MSVADQSQTIKPIAFVFHDMNKPSVRPKQMVLHIRPEELTRTDTSRLTPHQTIGGAFADSFGKGLPSVQIAGHTGWGSNGKPDGQAFFIDLHKMIYEQWHQARADAAKDENSDPDKVKLLFHDVLDGFTWVVAPLSFVLKRSLNNPLLSHYQISLIWVSDNVSDSLSALSITGSPQSKLLNAIASFDASIKKINDFAKEVTDDINGVFAEITAPMQAVMGLATHVNQSMLSVLKSGGSIVGSVTGNLTGLASNLSFTASTILTTVLSVADFPAQALHSVMQTRSAWLNVYCLLNNIINPQKLLPDYSQFYGAAMCSSTAGGRPVSAFQSTNTLALAFPMPTGDVVSFGTDAGKAIATLNTLDAVSLLADSPDPEQKQALLSKLQGLSETIVNYSSIPVAWQVTSNKFKDGLFIEGEAVVNIIMTGELTASMTFATAEALALSSGEES